jgi:hypothetical protein
LLPKKVADWFHGHAYSFVHGFWSDPISPSMIGTLFRSMLRCPFACISLFWRISELVEKLRQQLLDINASIMADGADWHLQKPRSRRRQRRRDIGAGRNKPCEVPADAPLGVGA